MTHYLFHQTGPTAHQLSFSDAEHNTKRKRTRREIFLEEMDRAMPWAQLESIIEPFYPKAGIVCCSFAPLFKPFSMAGRYLANWWRITGRIRALKKRTAINKIKKGIERTKASIRAKVEHPFRVIKCQFGFTKTRYRGLAKNDSQLAMLFALSNLFRSRHRLLA